MTHHHISVDPESIDYTTCGPDTLVIHENERGRHENAEYSDWYGEFLEVRTNASRKQLPAVAASLRQIADDLDTHWLTFDAARRHKALHIHQLAAEVRAMSADERRDMQRLIADEPASVDIPF